MGADQRRELSSRLETLMVHLLQCRQQPAKKTAHRLKAITRERSELRRLLQQSPSLKRLVDDYAREVYPHAVKLAALDTGIPAKQFPPENPFSDDQLLDADFLP